MEDQSELHQKSWQKIKQYRVATALVVLFFTLVVLVLLGGYLFHWDWTGFNSGSSQITITSTSKVNYTATVPQPSKSFWDWLGLLGVLAIPVVVGFGAAWFTTQQSKVSDREKTDNQREDALQAYLDKMSELLLEKQLRESRPDAEVRTMARTRTWTVLRILDPDRRGILFRFLYEADLISLIDLSKGDLKGANLSKYDLSKSNLREADLSMTNLKRANLSGVDLSEANLSGADLSEANLSEARLSEANLSGANLFRAILFAADLSSANLSEANLIQTTLSQARLSHASLRRVKLSGTDLREADLSQADLREADLSGTNLSNVYLKGANISGANISGANLSGAIFITSQELDKATSLKGAIMPDGSIHD